VVVLHGGGWEGGNRQSTTPEAQAIANRGLAAFHISYRLVTPSSPGDPGDIIDVRTAVVCIRANATKLGINPDEIGAFGVSAGGYLALELGTLGIRGGPSQVSAVVAWSAPTNLSALATEAVRTCTPLAACPRGSLQGLW